MSLSFLADQEIARRETAFIQRHVKHRVTARAHMMLNELHLPADRLNALEAHLTPLAAENADRTYERFERVGRSGSLRSDRGHHPLCCSVFGNGCVES